MRDVIAIIPARSGSKSVKNKNIEKICNYPLIAYTVAAAKLSKNINRVIVSTNNKDYAKIAKSFGAEVPFLRPTKISGPNSSDREFIIHAINWLKKNDQYLPEYWVHLRPTTPIRDPKIIDKAIMRMKKSKIATSLRSAHLASESPFKWFKLKKNNFLKEIVDNKLGIEITNLPKEKFDQVYIPNGYVDILRSSYMLNNDTIHGKKIMGFVTPIVSEVDSLNELDYIRYQMVSKNNPLLSYLKKNY